MRRVRDRLLWHLKRLLARPGRYHGALGGDTHLYIEVCKGHVAGVWFQEQPLPFTQVYVDAKRAKTDRLLPTAANIELRAVEVRDATT